jgi:hypothetical protein
MAWHTASERASSSSVTWQVSCGEEKEHTRTQPAGRGSADCGARVGGRQGGNAVRGVLVDHGPPVTADYY